MKNANPIWESLQKRDFKSAETYATEPILSFLDFVVNANDKSVDSD